MSSHGQKSNFLLVIIYSLFGCYRKNSVRINKKLKVGSHDPINIENFCMRDGICWCSHDPVFASNYFVTSSKYFNNSCFDNFMPASPQQDPAVAIL